MNMIYCVEDEEIMCDLMVYTLNNSGYQAEGFGDGEGLKKALKAETPELIILDVILPGESGLEILKQLRRNPETHSTPVILATSKTSEIDRVQGLDLGADCYMTKPIGMMELVATVRAVLRRTGDCKPSSVSAGNIVICPDERTVTVGGEPMVLTFKEYEILYLFMTNQGRVFTREQIIESIWGIEYLGESRTVDVHVGTLRGKLKQAGADGISISTLRSVGYKLEAG